jgi:hypothetical protein
MGRAGPPLLFGLAPCGVFRASRVAPRAVGSYPTFSPLPARHAVGDPAEVYLSPVAADCSRRRSVFCGTVRSRTLARATPWHYQAHCPYQVFGCRPCRPPQTKVESGLSSRPRLALLRAAGRRPSNSPATNHYTAGSSPELAPKRTMYRYKYTTPALPALLAPDRARRPGPRKLPYLRILLLGKRWAEVNPERPR